MGSRPPTAAGGTRVARIVTRIGDIFTVELGNGSRKFFQYVAKDATQLGSDVIRAFKEEYPDGTAPNLDDVVRGEVQFFAHCVVRWGVELGLWTKVGRSADIGTLDVWFRGTRDLFTKAGEEPIRVSDRWYVWKINEPFRDVGRLEGDLRGAEIGSVKNPHSVVKRIETGDYGDPYPGFE
jgi:hypothetical protein